MPRGSEPGERRGGRNKGTPNKTAGKSKRDKAGRFLIGHTEPGPGRDSIYDPAMNEVVRKLALLGATDAEMADILGITERTLNRWKTEYPAFCQSIMAGKIIADGEVADSLYKQATGYHITVEKERKNKQTGDYEMVKVQQYIPGNSEAAKFWMKNRRKDQWRDKHEFTGPDGGPLQVHIVKYADDPAAQ